MEEVGDLAGGWWSKGVEWVADWWRHVEPEVVSQLTAAEAVCEGGMGGNKIGVWGR